MARHPIVAPEDWRPPKLPSFLGFAGPKSAVKQRILQKAVIKGFLHLRSTGRVEGKISCGGLELKEAR
jgi:hypothetical protein